MYLVLQQDQPDDYVIATGITTSIRDFVKLSGKEIGIEIIFSGEGIKEKGHISAVDEKVFNEKSWQRILRKNEKIEFIPVETGISILRKISHFSWE